MPVPDQPRRNFRFGPFDLEPETGELRKNGRKVHLQEKPFQVLVTLLEQRGRLVSREALRQRLWPADTFVDFDNGLNTAVSKLREALGDSAERHRYLETMARRGYRFVGSVEELGAAGATQRRQLHIQEERVEPDIVLVQIVGTITFSSECQQIEWLIAHLIGRNEKKIILDLSLVTYVDSIAVGIIVHSSGKLKEVGGELRVAGAQAIVDKVLKTAMVDRFVALHTTVAAAIDAINQVAKAS